MARKSKKVEKETRRLMEGMADLVRKTKKGRYKFRTGKKKQIKKIKRQCVHWIMRKGRDVPTVQQDPTNPMNWRCAICETSFPVRPATQPEYDEAISKMLGYVNQMQFWSVKMGGDADDTKMFLTLKSLIPRFSKAQRNILKQVNKRQEWEDRKTNSDSLSQFDGYSGINYRS